MPHKKPNARQQRFINEYMMDLNATQATIRAGYSEIGARTQGARFLAHPRVAAVIAEKLAERCQNTGVSAEWLLARLVEEANAKLADLFDENGALKPVLSWPLVWRRGLVLGIDIDDDIPDITGNSRDVRGNIRDGVTTTVIRRIRVSDRVKRLELIGRHIHVGAFVERVILDEVPGLAERLARAGLAADG